MLLVAENIAGSIYIDVILSEKEVHRILEREMITASTFEEGIRFLVGVRFDSHVPDQLYFDEDDLCL